MLNQPLAEEDLNSIYNWVDQIPLTRPKKNIARDFSDGLLVAEIVYYFLPKLVDIHNYSTANSMKQKRYNWETLNTKVLKRIELQLSPNQIEAAVTCQPEAIERILVILQGKIDTFLESQSGQQYGHHQNGGNSYQHHSIVEQQMIQNQQQNHQLNDGWQKDQIIEELRETVEVLEIKLNKMDELLKSKDQKLQRYQQLLQQNGLI